MINRESIEQLLLLHPVQGTPLEDCYNFSREQSSAFKDGQILKELAARSTQQGTA
jgi:hypothetical protein